MSKKLTKDIANEEEKLEEKVAKKVAKTAVKETKETKKAATTKKGATTKKSTKSSTTSKKAVKKDDAKASEKVNDEKVKKEVKAKVTKKSEEKEVAKAKDDKVTLVVPEEKPKKRGRPKKVETEKAVEAKEEIKSEVPVEKETKKTTKKSTTSKKSAKKVDEKADEKNEVKTETKAAKTKKAATTKKTKSTTETKATKTAAKSKTASTRKKTTTSSTTKKATAKKTSTKKSSSKKKPSKNKRTIRFVKTLNLANQYLKKNLAILEYFDLPYRYNETTVKVLAQTPKVLFVYWDISDHDREQYILNYGENFFNETYPVLLVKNETLGYVEEIPINDFANSWYIHISDPRSKYSVELGRKYKNMPKFESPYIYIKDSNEIIAPNDHVLLNEVKPKIKYKNAKTNEVIFKNISNVIKDGKILDFYSLYQVIYNVEDINEFFTLDLNNPSSGNPTSTFK